MTMAPCQSTLFDYNGTVEATVIVKESRNQLNNGIYMPSFGMGLWDSYGENTIDSGLCGIENGYRLFDTALKKVFEHNGVKILSEAEFYGDDFDGLHFLYMDTKDDYGAGLEDIV